MKLFIKLCLCGVASQILNFAISETGSKNLILNLILNLMSFQVNLDEATDPWGVKVICIFSKENWIFVVRKIHEGTTRVHNSDNV